MMSAVTGSTPAQRLGPAVRSLVLLALLPLSACSTEQLYRSGQGWRENQCARIPDSTEAARCVTDTRKAYQSYVRQSEAR
jgi:hypothetical protein